jgi:hypothetical protein
MKKFIRCLYFWRLVRCCPAVSGMSLCSPIWLKPLKVVLKGSFESNSPRPWWDGAAADGTLVASKLADDSITGCRPDYTLADGPATAVYFDIAEMRMDGERFSNYRQTEVFSLNDDSPLFNGTGIQLQNDDVTPLYNYRNIEIYFRKLLFDQAHLYRSDGNGSWSYVQKLQSMFKRFISMRMTVIS